MQMMQLLASILASCLIAVSETAITLQDCPDVDGWPYYFDDNNLKCHPCRRCEIAEGLSEHCGNGLGKTAVCIPCPDGNFSPISGAEICRPCRICSNTLEDTIPCTAETDRKCGPCKFGYFRYEERHDHCVSCDDERSWDLYPDCLRTTIPGLIETGTRRGLMNGPTSSPEPNSMSPVVISILVVGLAIVIVVGVLLVRFCCTKKAVRSPNHKVYQQVSITDYNAGVASERSKEKPETDEETVSCPKQSESYSLDIAEAALQGAEDDENTQLAVTTSHSLPGNCSADMESQQRATPYCSGVNDDRGKQQTNSDVHAVPQQHELEPNTQRHCNMGTTGGCLQNPPPPGTTDSEWDHGENLAVDIERGGLNTGPGGEQHSSSRNSTASTSTQTDIAGAMASLSNNFGPTLEPPVQFESKADDEPMRDPNRKPTAQTNSTTNISPPVQPSEPQANEYLELAKEYSKDITIGSMHIQDRELLNTMLHEKSQLLSTSHKFHYVSLADLYDIPRKESHRFDTAGQVLDYVSATNEVEPTVADLLNKLHGCGKCHHVVRELTKQIVKRGPPLGGTS